MDAKDVSNPLKPFQLSRAWAHRVLDEFFLQGVPRQFRPLPFYSSFCGIT